MNIIVTTSFNSIGGTFVDWSINFLGGFTEFYNVSKNQYIPLSANPILKTNAHGHMKNHPLGYEQTFQQLTHLTNLNSNIYTLYPAPLRYDQAALKLGIEKDNVTNNDNHKKITNLINSDYKKIISHCLDSSQTKLIFLNINKDHILYNKTVRAVTRLMFENKIAKSPAEMFDTFEEIFFKNSSKFKDTEKIWDRRERLALCTRPFEYNELALDMSNNHLWIDILELWTNGEAAMRKVMDYVELEIDASRLDQWSLIYRQWLFNQKDAIEFSFKCKHIINCIVNNWYYELPDLSFQQEVVIQHCLMYFYNLNLKTWGLLTFPKNTQDLHKLLEANIHPIASIY